MAWPRMPSTGFWDQSLGVTPVTHRSASGAKPAVIMPAGKYSNLGKIELATDNGTKEEMLASELQGRRMEAERRKKKKKKTCE